MNMEKNRVKLNIAGVDYTIVTDDSPEYTMELGADLDEKIRRALKENSYLSVTQAAVLAALEYADSYKKSEESADNLRSQIRGYVEDYNRAKLETEVARKEVERLNRENQDLRVKLTGGMKK